MAIDLPNTSRRRFLTVAGVSTAAAFFPPQNAVSEESTRGEQPMHPNRSSLALNKADTAVVFIDPQNDVLRESGRAWSAVSESVKENKTIENMERIFKTAKSRGFLKFLSRPTTSFRKIRDGSSTVRLTRMKSTATCLAALAA